MRIELETRRFYLGRDYSEAIAGFGCLPLHIPLIPDAGYIDALVDTLDGVMLPGADCDVDPALYGEEPHPRLKKVVPEKDSTDRLVLAAAERRGIPVMAICYGMQALNVFRGGDLYQDIGSQAPDAIQHEQGIPVTRRSHSVSIEADGRLAELLSGFDGESLKVNSHHHQAIRNVGKDLTATARAADSIIEAIEDTRPERYVMGYQWHPELDWMNDQISTAIFESFSSACGQFAFDKSLTVTV
jgi:putative glutamine amidotransferase